MNFVCYVPENATRLCQANGTWSKYTNYTQCRDLSANGAIEASVEVTSTIYYAGYTLSLAALGFAVFIFLYFK
jgi:corticotropin releasing hormone receptor 1